MSESSDELKPCPFCGDHCPQLVMWDHRGYIQCRKCKASTEACLEPFNALRLYEMVIDRWNTRRAESDEQR